MIVTFLVSIAAGCASALMYASTSSGPLIAILLVFLAPLPLMVAGLGWGPLSATLGGIGASLGLAAVASLPSSMAFVVAVALPAWWLSHLTLLGRSPDTAAPLEWYPVGRILMWISGFAALTTLATLLTFGSDAEIIRNTLHEILQQVFAAQDPAVAADTEKWSRALVAIAPSSMAVITVLTLTLNLWLAARITATSGRLRRPWPALGRTALPASAMGVLLAAAAICFAGGLPAMFAQALATALIMSYALTGLAVLHTLTLALKSRRLWLSCAYALMIALPWTLLAMTALGLADAVFGFRTRYLDGRPPPLPAS